MDVNFEHICQNIKEIQSIALELNQVISDDLTVTLINQSDRWLERYRWLGCMNVDKRLILVENCREIEANFKALVVNIRKPGLSMERKRRLNL